MEEYSLTNDAIIHREPKTASITPIIVIGMIRSGTKWLSNILSNHPDVISVQLENARGIQETNMFGGMQYKFNLRHADEYIGLIELWSSTDFFQATGIDKEIFYRIRPRPARYPELFKILMDEFAKRHYKKYWLQKTGPVWASGLINYFPDAKYIIIKRNIVDTIRSMLQLYMNHGRTKVLNTTLFMYVYQAKLLNELEKKIEAATTEYNTLQANTAGEIQRICDEIGLDYQPDMIHVRYEKNSSFQREADRTQILSKTEEIYIKAMSKLLYLVPLPVMKMITRIVEFKNFLMRKNVPLIPGTFSTIKQRYHLA